MKIFLISSILFGLLLIAGSAKLAAADAVSVQAVDWASLNASTLAALPTTDFSSISSSQLASIPDEACAGFSSNQVAAVPQFAWSSLHPTQLGNISAAAFSGFSETAVGNIPNWSQVSADQIANITPAACAGFKSSKFNTVPASAVSGFSAQQVQNFNEFGACSIISAPQLANFVATAYAGFQPGCITKIPAISYAGATAAGVSFFTAGACGALSGTKMVNLNPDAYAGLTGTCVASLSYSADACGGLSAAGLAKIQPAAFGQITSACIGISPKPSWSGVTKEQIAMLGANQCGGFNSGQMTNLGPSGYSGFSSACVSSFSFTYSVDACAGLNATGVGAMAAEAFAGFKAGCLSISPAGAFSMANSNQIASLNQAACAGFSAKAMKGLNADAYVGFTAGCVSQIPYTYSVDGCHGFTAAGFDKMPPASFAGFTAGCLGALPADAGAQAHPEQISFLTASGCGGISYAFMVNLNPLAYMGFQSACLAAFPFTYSFDGCKGFSKAGFPLIDASQIGGIKAGCMSAIPGDAFTNATAAQIAGLSADGCEGMTKSQMVTMNAEAYSGFRSACLAALPSTYSVDACRGLNANVARIQPSQIGGIQGSCMNNAPSTIFSMASAALIAGLSDSGCSGLTAGQMTNMNGSAYAGFTVSCVSNFPTTYSSDACSGNFGASLPNMTAAAFAGFKSACIGQFQSSVVAAITVDQIKALPAPPCSGFGNLYAMQPATFTAMSLAQISSLSTYGVSSLTGPQFVELLTRWGKELLIDSRWSQSQLSRPVLSSSLYVKQAALSGSLTRFIPIPSDWAAFSCKITWLHFALFIVDPSSGWNADIINTLNMVTNDQCQTGKSAEPSLVGMRVDQVSKLTVDGAAAISNIQAQYLINDTVAAFDKTQWLALAPEAIGSLSQWGWQNVTCSDCISSLAPGQLAFINMWYPLPCSVMAMFQQSQLAAVNWNSFAVFNMRRKACGLDQFAAPPHLIFPPGFVVPPSSSINGSPEASNPGGAPIGAIVGGVIAAVVVVGAVGAFVYWRLNRRAGYTSVA